MNHISRRISKINHHSSVGWREGSTAVLVDPRAGVMWTPRSSSSTIPLYLMRRMSPWIFRMRRRSSRRYVMTNNANRSSWRTRNAFPRSCSARLVWSPTGAN